MSLDLSNQSEENITPTEILYISLMDAFDELSKGKELPKWFRPFFDNFRIFSAGVVKCTSSLDEKILHLEKKLGKNTSLLSSRQLSQTNYWGEKYV